MGSADMGNQNPWATYYTYKDCSQGICSIYCQQWCLFFPPPPPFGFDDGGDSGTDFSPLIIAVIGILASAFILVSYYTIISKYCRRRSHGDSNLELNENQDVVAADGCQGTTAGLDEVLIKSITVCKYNKGDGFVIEGSDCSVCLSEFQENESVRLLPKCNHAFHLPCIDTWLKSHASCPLCRTNIAPTSILPAAQPASAAAAPVQETAQQSSGTNVSALEYQHRTNDGIVVVQDLEGNSFDQTVVCLDVLGEDMIPKTSTQYPESLHQGLERSDHRIIEIRHDGIQPIRRSVSLHISPRESQVSIADILRISQDDEDYQTPEKSRNGILSLVRSPLAPMKRSISTGRFMLSSSFDKGRSSVIPN